MKINTDIYTLDSPHILSDRSEVLSQISLSGVNLCLWQRSPSALIAGELAGLGQVSWPDIRRATSPDSFGSDVCGHLSRCETDPSALDNFRFDLRQLAGVFFALNEGCDVSFRLFATTVEGCRRFHVDYRRLRLLCTYQGAGTEWLANHQVDRVAYEAGASNSEMTLAGAPSQFERFWVGILKDNAYPGEKGNGLMHRSPPASDSFQPRIVFCLDAS